MTEEWLSTRWELVCATEEAVYDLVWQQVSSKVMQRVAGIQPTITSWSLPIWGAYRQIKGALYEHD